MSHVGTRSAPLALELAMTERARIEIDENGLSRCVAGQLVYEPDIANVHFPFPQRLASANLGSMIVVPLMVEQRSGVFGVLVVARHAANAFNSGDCEFLRQLCDHVSLAANQAQLHESLKQAYDDLRRTQNAIMQQERLRALGQMASGIAHDINNAISPVALYVEALLTHEPGSAIAPASSSRSFSARSMTWRAPWRAWASSIASARRRCSWRRWRSIAFSARCSISRARAGATWRSSAAWSSRRASKVRRTA